MSALSLSPPPPFWFGSPASIHSRLFHCIKPGSVPFPTVLLQFVPLARNQIQFSLIPLVWIFCSDAPLTSFPHRRQYNKCTVSIHLLKITFPITYNSPWVLFFFELSVACVVCHNQFEMKRWVDCLKIKVNAITQSTLVLYLNYFLFSLA